MIIPIGMIQILSELQPYWVWVFVILGIIKWFEICIKLIKAGIAKVGGL